MKYLLTLLLMTISFFTLQAVVPVDSVGAATLQDCSTLPQDERGACLERNNGELAIDACEHIVDVNENLECVEKFLKGKTLSTDCEVDTAAGEELNAENCQIVRYIVVGTNFLTALAGLAITAGIIYAGYEYMTARDNPGQIQSARIRIVWALVALLILIFMNAFLQWLVPGGVL